MAGPGLRAIYLRRSSIVTSLIRYLIQIMSGLQKITCKPGVGLSIIVPVCAECVRRAGNDMYRSFPHTICEPPMRPNSQALLGVGAPLASDCSIAQAAGSTNNELTKR